MLYFLFAPTTPKPVTKVLRDRLAAAGEALWRWYRRRITIRELQGLDDRTLKDIGLDRSEIASAVYTGRGIRPASVEFDLYRAGR